MKSAQPALKNDPLRKVLSSLSGKIIRYFPKSGNLGDGFITYATRYLFEEHKIKFTSHRQTQRFDNEIIVIGGGGNLIEGRYDDVAKLIWEHRENNEIILLPHTIVGNDDLLKETFNNLTVFCRDKLSFAAALEGGANPERVHLSHDMTFFLPDDHFKQRHLNGRDVLNAFRRDGESLNKKSPQNIPSGNIDISLAWNGDLWTNHEFVHSATTSMADFISQYECVNTDRLHVSIMSAFLDRQVNFYPNAYFKNEAVFEHSIRERFPNVTWNHFAELDVQPTNTSDAAPVYVDWKTRFSRAQDERSKVSRQLIAANQTIGELNNEITRLNHSLDAATGQNRAAAEDFSLDLSNFETITNELRSANEELEKSSIKAKDELLRVSAELAKANQEVERLSFIIRDLFSSTSWRITRPIRVLKRLIIRRG